MQNVSRIGMVLAAVLTVTANPPAQAADATVAVSNNVFTPATVTIDAGDMVTWEWVLGAPGPHSVTADDGSFDSHPSCRIVFALCGIPGVTRFSVTFPTGGVSVGYYCRVHGAPGGVGMSGTVVVN